MATAVNTTTSTQSTSAAFQSANAASKSLIDETQDRFLTLLVTQMQNQDPLNPMDNAQITSQIAQLSTVNGITQLNNTLLALSGQVDVSQSIQAAGLIGKNVLFPGDKISLGTAADGTTREATPFGLDVISPAASVTVTVLDAAGKAVRTIEITDPQEVGIYQMSWDGKDDSGIALPDGKYTFKVAAKDADGEAVTVGALTYGNVGSVAYTAEGLRLDMGLNGKTSLLDIRKIL